MEEQKQRHNRQLTFTRAPCLQAADASDDGDELFRVRGTGGIGADNGDDAAQLDAVDTSRPGGAAAAAVAGRWGADGAAEALRGRFVTGEVWPISK
jgi:hypothetical protein